MLESSADLLQIIWTRILVEITLPCCADGVAVAKDPRREANGFIVQRECVIGTCSMVYCMV